LLTKHARRFVALLLDTLGISTVVAAFSLEFIIFHDILAYGYFHAVEGNTIILTVELLLAAYGLAYFLAVTSKRLRSLKEPEEARP
jgi:hypothetical protein